MFEGKNNWFVRHTEAILSLGIVCLAFGILLGLVIPLLYVLIGIGFVLIWLEYKLENEYEWICSKCGVDRLFREKYCSNCGGLMVLAKKQKRKCPNGHSVYRSDIFCPKCGVKINSNEDL